MTEFEKQALECLTDIAKSLSDISLQLDGIRRDMEPSRPPLIGTDAKGIVTK